MVDLQTGWASAGAGFLLDVDGPIASTVTRTLRLPSIAADLAALANAGSPVVFNTGRSDRFIAEQIVPPLATAGLRIGAPVWAVCEKGATWLSVVNNEAGPVDVDDRVAVSERMMNAGREIADRHRGHMFFDESKRTMVSLEQNLDVDNQKYLAVQPDAAKELQRAIDAAGEAARLHVVESSIALDVEHRAAGKALGAQRGIALVAQDGPVPQVWYTVGDSTGDYDMATWLHEQDYVVTHLDVRLAGDARSTAYHVHRELPRRGDGFAEDDITARYLASWRAALRI